MNQPDKCPTCGSEPLTTSHRRVHFACGAMHVLADAPPEWTRIRSCGPVVAALVGDVATLRRLGQRYPGMTVLEAVQRELAARAA